MEHMIKQTPGSGKRLKAKHIIAGMAAAICLLLLPDSSPAAGRGGQQDGESLFSRLEHAVPAGFTMAGQPQLFGTTERRLKDGTIFHYMDGGGVAYLEYGFVELFHAEFADGEKNAITLDVFVMGSAAQAQSALADERICPAGGSQPAFAAGGKAFRFPPDYFIYFSAGDRLAYLHVNNDLRSEILDRFARQVKPIIEKEEP